MYTLLLLLIYLAFISLGLPDSLLGSAWPVMHKAFQVPLSYAGLVTMIISGGTICSSLMSERLTKIRYTDCNCVQRDAYCNRIIRIFYSKRLLDALSMGRSLWTGCGSD